MYVCFLILCLHIITDGDQASSKVLVEKLDLSKKSGKLKQEETAQLKKLLAEYKKAGESVGRNEAIRERANPQQRVIQQFTEDYTAKVGVRYIVELDDDHIRLLRKVNKVFTAIPRVGEKLYTSPHGVMLTLVVGTICGSADRQKPKEISFLSLDLNLFIL